MRYVFFGLLVAALAFILIRGWLRVRRIDREMSAAAWKHLGDEHDDIWNHQ